MPAIWPVVVLGCVGSESSPPPPPPAVASLAITPVDTSIGITETVHLVAVARDSSGEPIPGATIEWTTEHPEVAVVSNGTVAAAGRGTVAIRAASGGRFATATVHVTVVPIAQIVVTPGSIALQKGLHTLLQVRPVDSRGQTLTGRAISWSAAPASVATIAANGMVSGVSNGRATIMIQVDDSMTQVGVTVSDAATNLRIENVEVIQNTQNAAMGVPFVTGHPTLVRVWISGTPMAQAPARVMLRIFRHGGLIETREQMSASPLPALSVDQLLPTSLNFLLPADFDLSGVSFQAMVDPDDVLAENDEFDNVFPLVGRLGIPAPVTLPLFSIMLVPINTGVGVIPSVAPGQDAEYAAKVRQYLPMSDVAISVHGAISYPVAAPGASASGMVAQLEAIRVAEGVAGHFYGLINSNTGFAFGFAGIGYRPGHSALGIDSPASWVIAHEIGHNLNLLHAPCGASVEVDPAYPYAGAAIGTGGYDATTNTWYPGASTFDLMSYCGPNWISDYSFNRALNWRLLVGAVAVRSPVAPPGPGILVWGGIDAADVVHIAPVFALARAVAQRQDSATGTAEGLADDGTRLFLVPITAHEVADGPAERHFAIAIPLAAADQARLTVLRVRIGGHEGSVTVPVAGAALRTPPRIVAGPGVGGRVITWEPASYRGAMIRDRVTGEVLGFGLTGSVALPPTAHDVDIELSDGLRSQTFAVRP